ncbi:HNH endonuclease [Neisseria musculi]|uniref:HNH endonuclease family protein n=1 Tax=Neisseria musculi TaxID=1815583 RepID=A0A7H1M9S9_9NEIS|nr:HNH endonuclease [Neisseria musculi]QNT58394.1 HNH endonuclease family protein [Neisseria musculi]
MAKKIIYSEDEKTFLKANSTLQRKELAAAFNKRFDRDLSVQNIKSMCTRNRWLTGRDGRFEKGSRPANKGTKGFMKENGGSFKKGHRPRNSVSVGTEVVAKDWVKVKVAEPNVWRNKSHMVWEQYHGSPPPRGMFLLHLDCDFTNNAIENLVMVSRADMGKLNKRKFRDTPLELRQSLVLVAKIGTAINNRKDGQ